MINNGEDELNSRIRSRYLLFFYGNRYNGIILPHRMMKKNRTWQGVPGTGFELKG